MTNKPAYKVAYVPWWRPLRLATRTPDGFIFIGWVWRQKARLVLNANHGWIAFDDEQTPEKLKTCACCGAILETRKMV